MTTHIWADCSNTQGRAADGASLRSIGCTALAAKASQGTTFTDGLLGANYAAARSAGLDFVAYHFLDTSDGAAQAEHFASGVQAACGTLELGLMLDWERVSYNPPGPIPSPATVDACLQRLAQLAPKAAISVYTSDWVVQAVGASALAPKYPLVWPSYVNGSGDPRNIVNDVTPGLFTPFGGWDAYAARQFTDQAVAGGFGTVDFNVCFDDAAYARLVVAGADSSVKPAQSTGTAGQTTSGQTTSAIARGLQAAVHVTVDGIWGSTTDAPLQLVRSAAHMNQRPDVKALQEAVGTTVDGDWRPGRRMPSRLL